MTGQNDTDKRKRAKKVMRKPAKVTIRKLPTGVRGLDEILGGGIPEFSFNIIAGKPGSGKTTLAHQFVFANATAQKPALYFTVLGEPGLKMLRYQQQHSFFDESKLGKAVRFINLSEIVMKQDLNAVLDEIIKQVTAANPSVVVVDSFRTMLRSTKNSDATELEWQSSIQRLAQFLTSWEATSFLVGEYDEAEMRENPVFTICDGLLWLSQVVESNSVVRKLQIIKLRGAATVSGLHAVRISDAGLQLYSRSVLVTEKRINPVRRRRLSMGVPELDKMMGGGILEGDSILIAGPSGTGKSILATHFIAEGLRRGEPGILAVFEERPKGYLDRAGSFGLNLKQPLENGKLEVLYDRPVDLSVDETMQELLGGIARVGAKWLVIDSLVGFEMALAPGYREDFRETLYRLIRALTGSGLTVLSTVEIEDSFTALPFSSHTMSFLTDDIIRLRYVEIDGQMRRVLLIGKMRKSDHSKDIREYVITANGKVVIQPRRKDYSGLITGLPQRIVPPHAQEKEATPEPKEKK